MLQDAVSSIRFCKSLGLVEEIDQSYLFFSGLLVGIMLVYISGVIARRIHE